MRCVKLSMQLHAPHQPCPQTGACSAVPQKPTQKRTPGSEIAFSTPPVDRKPHLLFDSPACISPPRTKPYGTTQQAFGIFCRASGCERQSTYHNTAAPMHFHQNSTVAQSCISLLNTAAHRAALQHALQPNKDAPQHILGVLFTQHDGCSQAQQSHVEARQLCMFMHHVHETCSLQGWHARIATL